MENAKQVITLEELKKMSEIDICTVDKNTLVDVKDVQIRMDLPKEERLAEYIRKIKNPYCYMSHGVVVKISFAGKCSLEECLAKNMKLI